ncbi:MAG: DNA internalization-related competence protein ComEC/Rec2 [Comamonadaceae bacterium]|nr:DNA internalization-related competence protein ComEC/Rec2 [Comamonadaceae bacterium]
MTIGLFALIAYALYALKIRAFKAAWKLPWWGTLILLAGLAFALTGARSVLFQSKGLQPALEGRDLAVTGVVARMPQRSEVGIRFRLSLESARLDGQAVALPRQLDLTWYSGVFGRGDGPGEWMGELQRVPAPLQAGERWQFTVRLKAPHGGINPHGFDYELMQWEQGVQATGYVRAGPKDAPPQRLAMTAWHPVEWARQQLRERIDEQVAEPAAAGLMAALVVGDQAAIDRADWDVFRATGVAHLMSISGLHITLFAWLAGVMVGALWRRSGVLCLRLPAASAALLGGMGLATAYAVFSGFGVPAQRTVLMLACVGLLRLSGMRWPWPQVWLLTCAVVVLADPWAMLQPGFWLSFVAVGILFATYSEAASAYSKRARGLFSSIFREQWVITLALAPLSLVLFGQVSLVGLPANALAIPWVTLVITPLAMLGVLVPGLWQLAAWACAVLAAVLQALAGLSWAVFSVAQAPWWAAAAGVLGGVLLVQRLPGPLRALGLPMMMPVLLWQPAMLPSGEFELLVADIGQGNAVLVRTAQHALLFDAGPRFSHESDAGQRVLVPLLRAMGVSLNMLVLSHRDSDHTGGAAAVLATQPQAELLSSIEDDNALQAQRPARRCEAGQHWQWDGVDFDVLHPSASDYGPTRKTNAMSCVLRISNRHQTALLAGDIEQAQEARLVQQGVQALAMPGVAAPTRQSGLRADLLLVPHHGSKTSSSAAFIDTVQPRIAVVQAGYRNRFGHPAGPVLVRYADRQVQVIDTPHCGALTWQSWRANEPKCQRVAELRYWRHQF